MHLANHGGESLLLYSAGESQPPFVREDYFDKIYRSLRSLEGVMSRETFIEALASNTTDKEILLAAEYALKTVEYEDETGTRPEDKRPAPDTSAYNKIDSATWIVINNLTAEDKKIQAIKTLRDSTYCSLKSAKDFIDLLSSRIVRSMRPVPLEEMEHLIPWGERPEKSDPYSPFE